MAENNRCGIEFINSIKDIIGRADGKNVLKAITDRAAQLKNEGIGEKDAIDQAAREFADRTREIGKQRTRQQLTNIKNYNTEMEHALKFPNPLRGLLSLVGGVEGSRIKGAKNSIDAAQREAYGRLSGRLQQALRREKLDHALHDVNNHLNIMEEMYDPGITDNVEAQKLAKIIKTVYGTGRALLNHFGAAIADLNEYVGRQVHNPERMLKLSENPTEHRRLLKEIKAASKDAADRRKRIMDMAYSAWSKYILPRLDQERTFKDTADTEKFLRGMFEDIIDGKYDTNKGGSFDGDFKFTGPGNIAKKVSRRRIIHFKDGKATFEYNNKYGHGSFPAMLQQTIAGMSRNIGLMRVLGPNARSMFDKMKDDLFDAAIKRGIPKGRAKRMAGRAENIYRGLSGELNTPVDNMLAKIGVGARVAQVFAKMGAVTISALPDLGNKAAQLRSNGVPWLESESAAFLTTIKGLTPDERYIADLCGTYFESLTQQLMHQFTGTNDTLGKMTNLMQKFYHITGITALDQVNRISFTHYLSRHLVLESGNKFSNLHESLQKRFNEHGIGEKEWDLMRAKENIQRPVSNKRFITPDGARSFTDESIAKYLGKDKATPSEIANVKDDMEFNMRTYFLNNSDNINMMAGATERAIMHQGLDPNTPAGQGMRALMQFKGFILSLTRRQLGQYFGDAIENGFKFGDTFTMSDVQHIVQTALSLWAYGYLSISIWDTLQGKSLRDPTNPKTMLAAFLKGGAAGLYGDFLIGNFERGAGDSFTDAFGGATLSTATQVYDLFSRLERMDHPGTALFHFIKNNLPLMNLWYAKAAFNYLFLYGIQEKINPGSLSRMQNHLEENYGQHFIFDPDTYAKQF